MDDKPSKSINSPFQRLQGFEQCKFSIQRKEEFNLSKSFGLILAINHIYTHIFGLYV